MVALEGLVIPHSGGALRPLAPPRRAVGLEFYVAKEAESMEAEWQNRVINGPTRPMLPFSASVGLRPNTLGPCITAYG